MFALKSVGESVSLCVTSFWWWLPVLRRPWLAAVSLQPLPLLLRGPPSVSLLFSSYEDVTQVGLAPTRMALF